MKKYIISWACCILILFVCLSSAYAQRAQTNTVITPVRVGSVILNIGAGVGGHYRDDYYSNTFGTKVTAEWGLWQAGPGVITLGPELGGSFSGGYYNNYRSRTVIAAARSAWHFGWKVPGLDTYGGLSAGIGFHHYDYRNDHDLDHSETIPVIGGFIGASYFVSPIVGFNAEAGYDITNLQIGLVFRLK